MTERTKRRRVVVKEMITDELLRLFRKAITAELALQGKAMSVEEHKAVLADYHAFHRAIHFPLYAQRFPPPNPLASGEWRELQDELLAKIAGSPEEKAWKQYVSRWQKERADDQVEDRKQTEKSSPAKNSAEETPRPELRWAKSNKGRLVSMETKEMTEKPETVEEVAEATADGGSAASVVN